MMAAMKNWLLLTNLGKELKNVLVSKKKKKIQEINWKILTKDVFAKSVMEGALFKTGHMMIVCIY